MKRTPLVRKTPLKPVSPLERTTAWSAPAGARSSLHANAASRHHQPKRRPSTPGIPKKVRVALAKRSAGICEIGQRGCTVRATEFAHRKKTGAGGRKGFAKAGHDVLSNALHLCWHCHHVQCHSEPAQAYAHGWMLREHQSPAAEPALYRGVYRWLTNGGHVLTTDPITDEAA